MNSTIISSSNFIFALVLFLDNDIGAEGADALAESLRLGTALEKLNLGSMSIVLILFYFYILLLHGRIQFGYMYFYSSSGQSLGNNVGVEGTRALAESIKQNTTLSQLILYSMLKRV